MIREKMIRGAGQAVYRIPEKDNDNDEEGLSGHVTE